MRVQFAPCGVGLGHAGRCIPIARKLKETDETTQIFFSTYREAVEYVRQEGFPAVEVPSMDFKVKPDGTVDFRRTAMNPGPFVAPFNFVEQVGKELEIMGTFEPDLVVSDSRASPIVAARMLGIPSICILNQFQVIIPRRTRYLRLAKFADAMTLAIVGKIWTTGERVIVPDFPAPYTICTENLRIPKAYRSKIHFIGPILPVRQETLPTRNELRKKLQLPYDKTIIFAPISGPENERAYFSRILKGIFADFPDTYQIIMSLGDPKSQARSVRYGNLAIYSWIPDRFEILKASDIVISRAGHGTIMHTICYGKPAILIPTPSHTEQYNNAKKAVELGSALVIDQKNLNKEILLSAVERIVKENRFRERAVKIQERISDFNGLEEAVNIAREVAGGSKIDVLA